MTRREHAYLFVALVVGCLLGYLTAPYGIFPR